MKHLRLLDSPPVAATDQRDDDKAHEIAYKHAQAVIMKLNDVRSRRATYVHIARDSWDVHKARPALSDKEWRLLTVLVDYADADLSNSFPGITTLVERTHLQRRNVYTLIRGLVRKGWVRRHATMRRGPAYNTGPSVNQFCVPNGTLTGAHEWFGPHPSRTGV